MKYTLSEIDKYHNNKVSIPNIIHFVWVGDTNRVCTDYISIWKKTNKDKKVYFWCDPKTSLSLLFHNTIKDYITRNHFDDPNEADRRIKNCAFDYIFPRVIEGEGFDECVISFLEMNNIIHDDTQIPELNPWFEKNGIEIKNINELFTNKKSDYMRYYYYEIILRGNLASASDITRLLIIYMYGGGYIDVDTLPAIDDLFLNLNHLIEQVNYKECDYLMTFKTKKILDKLSFLKCEDSDCLNNYKINNDNDTSLYKDILKAINSDISNFSLEKISPLGTLFVHKNLLSIGAVKRLKGVYFNNFLFSHSHSKTVSIILRSMKKRYIFLEKNGCVFNFYKGDREYSYLSRILTWRNEFLVKKVCVTSIMTGPGLIVEVMFGIAYELINLDSFSTPCSVAEYMHNETMGVASFQHNLDTPEGADSSWRR